ncbi:MAG: hypothetical protein L0338_34410, partial [Acidobacteria bacterium]|nr:hypothetical protein [Acidobacteriota bacterium]
CRWLPRRVRSTTDVTAELLFTFRKRKDVTLLAPCSRLTLFAPLPFAPPEPWDRPRRGSFER